MSSPIKSLHKMWFITESKLNAWSNKSPLVNVKLYPQTFSSNSSLPRLFFVTKDCFRPTNFPVTEVASSALSCKSDVAGLAQYGDGPLQGADNWSLRHLLYHWGDSQGGYCVMSKKKKIRLPPLHSLARDPTPLQFFNETKSVSTTAL